MLESFWCWYKCSTTKEKKKHTHKLRKKNNKTEVIIECWVKNICTKPKNSTLRKCNSKICWHHVNTTVIKTITIPTKIQFSTFAFLVCASNGEIRFLCKNEFNVRILSPKNECEAHAKTGCIIFFRFHQHIARHWAHAIQTHNFNKHQNERMLKNYTKYVYKAHMFTHSM